MMSYRYTTDESLKIMALYSITHFYISNLVVKAPGLNLDQKLSNFLSNCDALN